MTCTCQDWILHLIIQNSLLTSQPCHTQTTFLSNIAYQSFAWVISRSSCATPPSQGYVLWFAPRPIFSALFHSPKQLQRWVILVSTLNWTHRHWYCAYLIILYIVCPKLEYQSLLDCESEQCKRSPCRPTISRYLISQAYLINPNLSRHHWCKLCH